MPFFVPVCLQSEIGVDAGLYARQLMNAALASADSVQSVNDLSPQVSVMEQS